MLLKIVLLCAALTCMDNVCAQVNSPSPSTPNVLDSFQKHMEQLKNCLDQALAKTVDEVNVKQIQPVFGLLGDQLNRFSKAFEDLTVTKPPPA